MIKSQTIYTSWNYFDSSNFPNETFSDEQGNWSLDSFNLRDRPSLVLLSDQFAHWYHSEFLTWFSLWPDQDLFSQSGSYDSISTNNRTRSNQKDMGANWQKTQPTLQRRRGNPSLILLGVTRSQTKQNGERSIFLYSRMKKAFCE